MNTTKRYHPIMVVLHWLTVILILGAGFLAEDEGGGSPINIHMILGALLLVTLVLRLIVRFATKRPEWANTGDPFLNKLGELVHVGLYFFAFFILALGGLIATQRNLIGYVLGSGSVARVRLGIIGPLHHLGWIAVIGLLFLHIGGALYHQFIIKDNLFSRMWFGKQSS
ncbi:MAG: cytochrome b/b6 domain-containing protein [Chloroflexi bacterium]|nr:cytochrome b/b6 domain-containing protein [Chloroflexota bacterium]